MNTEKFEASKYRTEIKGMVQQLESMRRSPENPMDVTLEQFLKKKYDGLSLSALFEDLGIDPNFDTVQNLFTMPDADVRWLVPEIIRAAIRLGLRKKPIWADLIASEQTIKQPQAVVPHLNMSDAAPRKVGQAETISLGNISYGQKTFKLNKIGRGISIPYEVSNYVSINVISIFLEDFGVKLSQAIDTLMIDVLLNGEQTDGMEAAAVVGVTTPGQCQYIDLLTVWVRMSRLGKTPKAILGGETSALNVLQMNEFKIRYPYGTTLKNLDVKTPVPQGTDYYIHGAMPADQQIFIDPSTAIIKYNAQPLLVESEKIVSNQTEATYCTLTTGFAIAFNDGRIVMDQSLPFSEYGFPSFMNVDAAEVVNIE
jgi:hypothetical protein